MNISGGKIKAAQKVVVYGPEGIGKTSFAASFPRPVFSDTEGSTKRLDVMRFDAPKSFAMLVSQAEYVRDNPGVCGTYVVDTFDWAEKLAIEQVCANAKKNGIEDFGYGKGYVYLNETLGKLLNILEEVVNRGVNVVVTAHAMMRKFEQPDEFGSYDRWELKADKRNASMLKEWADMVLFANYKTYVVQDEHKKVKAQGGSRVMFTSHHPCWDAKNREGLAPELPFEFASIAHLFEPETSVTQVTAAPAEVPKEEPPKESAYIEGATKEESCGIPQSLLQMMQADGVTEEEIRKTVAAKGYYPENTPIANYDPKFIDGWILTIWPQLVDYIKTNLR